MKSKVEKVVPDVMWACRLSYTSVQGEEI